MLDDISDNTLFFTLAVALVITFGIYNRNQQKSSHGHRHPHVSTETTNNVLDEQDVQVALTYNDNSTIPFIIVNPMQNNQRTNNSASSGKANLNRQVMRQVPSGTPVWNVDAAPVGSNSCKSLNNKQLAQVTLGCSGPENVGNMENCIQQTCSR